MRVDRLRGSFAVIFLLILATTNVDNTISYLNGSEAVATASAKWDTPQIKILNTLLLIVIISIAIIRPSQERDA